MIVGHGIHKTAVEQGEFFGDDDNEKYYRQKGHIGDCIVNTDGSPCSELVLARLFATAVKEDATIHMFMDMCRTEDKGLGL